MMVFDRARLEKRNFTGTDKVPVGVIGSQFLVGTSLNNVNPLGNFELAGTLEVSSVSLNEG